MTTDDSVLDSEICLACDGYGVTDRTQPAATICSACYGEGLISTSTLALAHRQAARAQSETTRLRHQRDVVSLALADLLKAIGHLRVEEPMYISGPELVTHAADAARMARGG